MLYRCFYNKHLQGFTLVFIRNFITNLICFTACSHVTFFSPIQTRMISFDFKLLFSIITFKKIYCLVHFYASCCAYFFLKQLTPHALWCIVQNGTGGSRCDWVKHVNNFWNIRNKFWITIVQKWSGYHEVCKL